VVEDKKSITLKDISEVGTSSPALGGSACPLPAPRGWVGAGWVGTRELGRMGGWVGEWVGGWMGDLVGGHWD